jgi:hypothetical protein
MILVVIQILMTLTIMILPIKNDRRSDLGADFWLDQSGQFCLLLLPRFVYPLLRFRHGLTDAAIHLGSFALLL